MTLTDPPSVRLLVVIVNDRTPELTIECLSSLDAEVRALGNTRVVAEGESSPATAKVMHISIKTVETHRRNIVQKLDLHGTAELTKYAVREGLTSLQN